jgi:hypothetical protein
VSASVPIPEKVKNLEAIKARLQQQLPSSSDKPSIIQQMEVINDRLTR